MSLGWQCSACAGWLRVRVSRVFTSPAVWPHRDKGFLESAWGSQWILVTARRLLSL